MTCTCSGKHDFLKKLHEARNALIEALAINYGNDAPKIKLAQQAVFEAGLAPSNDTSVIAHDLVRLHDCGNDFLQSMIYVEHAFNAYCTQPT